MKNVPSTTNKNNQTQISNNKTIQSSGLGHGWPQISAPLDASINAIQPIRLAIRLGYHGKLPSTPFNVSFNNNNNRNKNEKYKTNRNNSHKSKQNLQHQLKKAKENKDTDTPEIAEIQTNDSVPCNNIPTTTNENDKTQNSNNKTIQSS